jgi:hypothetical protein
MAAYAVVSIALAFALGVCDALAVRPVTHRRRGTGELSARVVKAVRGSGLPPSGVGVRYYKSACVRCLAQRNVNASPDGTPYVPPRDR